MGQVRGLGLGEGQGLNVDEDPTLLHVFRYAGRPAQSQELLPSEQQLLSELDLGIPAQVMSVLLPGDRATGGIRPLSRARSGKP